MVGMFGRRAALVAGLLAPVLAGCGGVGTFGESGGSELGRLALFGNPQNLPAERPPEPEDVPNCPAVGVIEGAAAWRVGRANNPSEVAHQASLTDVARECRFSPGQLSLKVGVEGRMIIGAIGKPGTYAVPVKVQVKRADQVVATRTARVSVTVPAGQGSVAFAHVEDNIVVPVTKDRDPADEYDIYVGFEPGAAPASSRRRNR